MHLMVHALALSTVTSRLDQVVNGVSLQLPAMLFTSYAVQRPPAGLSCGVERAHQTSSRKMEVIHFST
jgi:ABC-type uncharacterized transport system permease subunit